MAAAEYEKLFEQGESAVDRIIAAREKMLIAAYKESLEAMRSEIAQVFAKYAKGDALTYAEMTKYNRLTTLYDNVEAELKRLGGKSGKILNKLGEDVYESAFFRTAYAIEAGGSVMINWGLLNPDTIRASVQAQIGGHTLHERLKKMTDDDVYRIRGEITQSLIRGESYPKMAKRIKKVYDMGATTAMKYARTEGHRNSQAGRLESLERGADQGVEMMKVWSATLDNRTRTDHRIMDGQKVQMNEEFTLPDGNKTPAPGMSGIAAQDVKCRCSVRAEVMGFAPKVRRIKGEGIQEYQTYSEWESKRRN